MTFCVNYEDRAGNAAIIEQDKPFTGAFRLTISTPTSGGPALVQFTGTYTTHAGALRAMRRHMDHPRRVSPDLFRTTRTARTPAGEPEKGR